MSSPRISLSDNDVLLGRGAGTRERKANRQFLSIVQQYKEVWALTITRQEKLLVAREVLNRVKMQGRFLEPSEDTHSDELWHEVDDNKVIDKIKQALREAAQKMMSQSIVPEYPGTDLFGTALASLVQTSLMAHGMSMYRLATHEAVARTLPMVLPSIETVPVCAATSPPPAITPSPFPSGLCHNLVSPGSDMPSFGQLASVSNTTYMLQQKEPSLVTRQEQLSCDRQDRASAEAQVYSLQASQPSNPEQKFVLSTKPSASHKEGKKKESNGKGPFKKRQVKFLDRTTAYTEDKMRPRRIVLKKQLDAYYIQLERMQAGGTCNDMSSAFRR